MELFLQIWKQSARLQRHFHSGSIVDEKAIELEKSYFFLFHQVPPSEILRHNYRVLAADHKI